MAQRAKILTQRLEIRLSPQDKDRIARAAREAGTDITSYIRRRLLLHTPTTLLLFTTTKTSP